MYPEDCKLFVCARSFFLFFVFKVLPYSGDVKYFERQLNSIIKSTAVLNKLMMLQFLILEDGYTQNDYFVQHYSLKNCCLI